MLISLLLANRLFLYPETVVQKKKLASNQSVFCRAPTIYTESAVADSTGLFAWGRGGLILLNSPN